MRFWHAVVLGMVACLVGGCASIADGTTESIYVTSLPDTGANCEVTNARGSWSAITPGTVVVKKSDSVLAVHCTKDGRRDAKEYYAAKLPTDALIGAMIPYAGIVSAAVDGSSGASGEYPNTITIIMQKIGGGVQGTEPAPKERSQATELSTEGVP
jgi:hypothetical protein